MQLHANDTEDFHFEAPWTNSNAYFNWSSNSVISIDTTRKMYPLTISTTTKRFNPIPWIATLQTNVGFGCKNYWEKFQFCSIYDF